MGHVLETTGIATASISLIREHSAGMRPPRALWVPFELGRPFGLPNDSPFQMRVLRSLLALFERDDGPVVLEDFDEPMPQAGADEMQGMFCALPIPKPAADANDNDLIAALQAEIETLAPWHTVRMAMTGVRTATGATGLTIEQLAGFLAAIYRQEPAHPAPTLSVPQTLRLSADELRLWCIEAALAKPGDNLSVSAIEEWFWGNTATVRLLLALQPICAASEDPEMAQVGKAALIPQSQLHRLN